MMSDYADETPVASTFIILQQCSNQRRVACGSYTWTEPGQSASVGAHNSDQLGPSNNHSTRNSACGEKAKAKP